MPLARADVRDVCFCHWPVDAEDLASQLPAALSPATRDGTAWVSVLAQHTGASLHGVPGGFEYAQLAIRTYVSPAEYEEPAEHVGVHFLDVEASSRFASLGARVLYEVPFRHTGITHRRDGHEFVVESDEFLARFEPHGDPNVPDPDSVVAWVTDRDTYYLPDGRQGDVEHSPWTVSEVDVTVEKNDLFGREELRDRQDDPDQPDRPCLPDPVGDPVFRYSPGADFRLKRRS